MFLSFESTFDNWKWPCKHRPKRKCQKYAICTITFVRYDAGHWCFFISYISAPEFVKRLNSFEEAKAGTDVVFACQWKGFPKPTIKWYRDDEEITPEDSRYQVTSEDNGILTLCIEKCRKQDEGAFKCKAENSEGVTSTTGYLSVTGR